MSSFICFTYLENPVVFLDLIYKGLLELHLLKPSLNILNTSGLHLILGSV